TCGEMITPWDAGGRSLGRVGNSSRDDYIHSKLDQLIRQRWQAVSLVSRPAIFDHKVPAFNVASLAQTPPEASQPGDIGFRRAEVQIPDHRHQLLRARRERPRGGRAAEQRDEVAPLHSITSSALASNVGGASRPSVFAVLRLMTSSYFVGACTGRSAGFSPLRMRST